MRLNWKILRVVLYPAILLLGAGCGGISASKSVSPATFLLPGLLQTGPAPTHQDAVPPTEDESAKQLAQF